MKRIILFAVLGFCLALPSFSVAQDSGEVGVFANYLRFSPTEPDINFVGVGGRVAFNVRPSLALEGEMSYDFKRNTTSVFSNGVTTQFVTTRFRPLTALFGPKFQTPGPFHAFVTGKVGFVNFDTSNQGVLPGFVSQVGNITDGATKFAMYPGAGIEGFWGPFGMRLDIGDEIYFADGAKNNLKISVGPVFRF